MRCAKCYCDLVYGQGVGTVAKRAPPAGGTVHEPLRRVLLALRRERVRMMVIRAFVTV